MADENPRQDEEDGVDGHNPDGNALAASEDIGQHDGETRDGADDEFAGHQEVVDGGGADHHSEGHNDQLAPEFRGFHHAKGIEDFAHVVVVLSVSVSMGCLDEYAKIRKYFIVSNFRPFFYTKRSRPTMMATMMP